MGKTGVATGGGALGGAAAGASIGSIVPGIGTAIGAGVGALAGGTLGFFGSKELTPPPIPDIPVSDPRLDALTKQASDAQIASLTTQAQGDTAALMARYGARLAMANGSTGSPLIAPTPPSAAAPPNLGAWALSQTALGR